MKGLLLIIAVSFINISYSQKQLSGIVLDKVSRMAIPYATVGLVKQNTGTNADETGHFTLRMTKPDSMIISAIGYETLKVPASQLSYDSIIQLNRKDLALPEVKAISKTQWSYATLNKYQCSNKGISSSGFTKQLAQRFNSPSPQAQLTEIIICTNTPPFSNKQAKFRLRIYDADSTGRPGNELTTEILEVESNSKLVHFDVEKLKIHIPGNDFFIAVEWLKLAFNEINHGKSSNIITYRPSISLNQNKEARNEVWILNYQNNWQPVYGGSRTAISVRVKY